MKSKNPPILIPVVYALIVCDFDSELAADLFTHVCEELGLYGKKPTKDDCIRIIKRIEEICQTTD